MHQNTGWTWIWAVALSVALAGCCTQARWVNCDQKLVPINQPAPKAAKPGSAQP